MKKKFFILTMIVWFAAMAQAQNFFNKYIKEAGIAYTKKDYLKALERYDLAWEYADTEPRKKITNAGKKKCRNVIRQQNNELQQALEQALKKNAKKPNALPKHLCPIVLRL